MSNIYKVYEYIDKNTTLLKPGETGCAHHLLVHAKRVVNFQELMANLDATKKKRRWWNEEEAPEESDKTSA